MRSDRGAAVVWSLALMAVLGLVAYVGAAVGALAVARQQAATVADLAALAAAQSAVDPCDRARAVAATNAVQLVGCRVEGDDVVVDLRARVPTIAAGFLAAIGAAASGLDVSARAGAPGA